MPLRRSASSENLDQAIASPRSPIPSAFADRYASHYAADKTRVLAISVAVATALYASLLPMDWLLMRDVFGLAAFFRLGVILPLGVLAWVAVRRRHWSLRRRQALACGFMITCVALLALLVALSHAPQAPGYLIGNFVLMFFTLSVMALPYTLAGLMAGAIVVIQTVTLLCGVAIPDILALHNTLASLLFIPLAWYVGDQFENARRTQFLLVERERLRGRVIADQRDLLGRLAAVDPLTELANRRGFEAAFAGDIERAPANAFMGLAIIDIDWFKAYNDRYGHPAGDAALRRVSGALEEAVGIAGRIARFGGEEFVAGFVDMEADEMSDIAARICSDIERCGITHHDNEIERVVTVSVGLAIVSGPDSDISALMRAADNALYRAKEQGRNRVVVEHCPSLGRAPAGSRS